MKRANLVFTVTAWTLAVATIVLNDTVGPLVPSRVNIRWSEAASSGQQRQVEQDLGLAVGERVDGRTWSYVLQNQSPQIIARIVRHPLVDDTHHIDRVKYTIELDVSGHPRWVQRLAELPQIARFAHRLPVVALLFVLVGLLGLWPARDVVFGACRSAVPGVRVPRTGALAPERGTGYALALIALVSLLLRIVLVSSGGQFYWPDEVRYEQARLAAGILTEGEIGEALRRLSYGDHPLFRVLGLVPAAVELAVGENPKVPGVFFAVFSALNIGLLGLIAIRLGATQAEAVAAAGLLALSNAFFYYARHLLPYDSAMTFGLLALYVGVRPNAGLRSSFTCGAFAGCAFLTYTGYWTLAGTALLLHVIDGGYRSGTLSKAVFGTFGITAAVGIVIGADAFSGGSLLSDLIAFSGNVNQGRFEEGWRLPWEYLWHAERLVMIVWLLGALWCIVNLRSGVASGTARVGLLGVGAIYASLVVSSVVLEKFVVYGRLVRQLVPFFCLVTAAALFGIQASVASRARFTLTHAVMILLIVQAMFNFMTPLRQVFPSDFLRDAANAPISVGANVIPVNAKHLYPGPERVVLPPRYTVIKQVPHPLQFLPYQYEGYTPAERTALRSTDISMRMIVPRY